MNNIPTIDIPNTVSYFNAYVPNRTNGREDATRIVGRYLYGQFEVVDVTYASNEQGEPFDCWRVKVRGTFYGDRVDYHVGMQRDRLSSGLYATSEPVLFERKEV